MTRKIKYFLTCMLSIALVFSCIMAVKLFSTPLVARAENSDNNWLTEGGSYVTTNKSAASVDGIVYTVTPETAGGDVTMTLNGGYRQYSGNRSNNTAGAYWSNTSWYGGRQLWRTSGAQARIITLRSPSNPSREVSFVSTQYYTYGSLISDITFKDGIPYVTGTNQQLKQLFAGGLASVDMRFEPATTSGVIGGTYYTNAAHTQTEECKATGIFKQGNTAKWQFIDENDNLNVTGWCENLTGSYAERYSEANVRELLRDFAISDVIMEIKLVGITDSAELTLRSLNGTSYYSGQTTLSLKTPDGLGKQVASYVTPSVTSLSAVQAFAPLSTTGSTTKSFHGFKGVYKNTWTYNSGVGYTNTGWFTSPDGSVSTSIGSGDPERYKMTARLALTLDSGSAAGYNGWALVDGTDDLIVQTNSTLPRGKSVAIKDYLQLGYERAFAEDDIFKISMGDAVLYTGALAEAESLAIPFNSPEQLVLTVEAKDRYAAEETWLPAANFTFSIPTYTETTQVLERKEVTLTEGKRIAGTSLIGFIDGSMANDYDVEISLGGQVVYTGLLSGYTADIPWNTKGAIALSVRTKFTESTEWLAAAEFNYIVKANADWKIEGGSYTYANKAAKNEDGIKYTIIPDEANGDVTMTLNGGYTQKIGTSFWAGRVILGGSENIKARILTYRSASNPDLEISIVGVQGGITYFSLISDISFDANMKPYITGTNQYLSGLAGSVGIGGCEIYLQYDAVDDPAAHFQRGAIKWAGWKHPHFNLLNADQLEAASANLSDEYKNRYSTGWTEKLLTEFAEQYVVCEVKLVGVAESGTVLNFRNFNGKNYMANQVSEFASPSPLLVQRDTIIVDDANCTASLRNLIELWAPNDWATTYTLHGFRNSTAWGKGTYDNNVTYQELVADAKANGGIAKGVYAYQVSTTQYDLNSSYLFASWRLVSATDEIVKKGIDSIEYGDMYNLGDILAVADGRHTDLSKVNAKVWLGSTAEGSPIYDGTINACSFRLGGDSGLPYDRLSNTFTISVSVNSPLWGDASAAASTFTINVGENLPEVSVVADGAVVGIEWDLNELFYIDVPFVKAVEYFVNGNPVDGNKYTFNIEDVYTVKCKVTDDRDYTAEETASINVYDFAIPAEFKGEIEKDVITDFADPAIPMNMQYTAVLYAGIGEQMGIAPIAEGVSYCFTKNGEYTLIYTITLLDTGVEPIIRKTEYTVTLVEQKPVIEVNGTFANEYYSGMTIDVPSATADNSYSSYEVAVTATKDGEAVAITEGKIISSSAGNYKVVYTANYGEGLNAVKEYTFTVIADDIAPVMSINGVYDKTYEKGQIVAVLGAMVVDNSGVEIKAVVTIKKDGKAVEVTNNTFVVENGNYEITYTATDCAGNSTKNTFTFVGGNGQDESFDNVETGCKGCKTGCTGMVSTNYMLISVILLLGVVIFMKGRANYEK